MLFIFFVPVQNYIYMHELAHQTINKSYGADSNIEMEWGFGKTIQTSKFPSVENQEKATEFNILQEIISYNVSTLLIWIAFILTFGFFFNIAILIKIHNKLDDKK